GQGVKRVRVWFVHGGCPLGELWLKRKAVSLACHDGVPGRSVAAASACPTALVRRAASSPLRPRRPRPSRRLVSFFGVFVCWRLCGLLRCACLLPKSSWMPCITDGVAPPQRLAHHASRGVLFQAR